VSSVCNAAFSLPLHLFENLLHSRNNNSNFTICSMPKNFIVASFLSALIIVSVPFVAGAANAKSEQVVSEHAQAHAPVCAKENNGEARCHARVVVDAKGAPAVTSLPAGFGPNAFHAAYGSVTTASTKQIIAIVDAYDHPYILSDLNFYSTTYGIPTMTACVGPVASSVTPCFQKVNQNGAASPLPQVNAGWALEIALDVEAAHAMCQNCSILLVEATSNSYANLMAAVDRAVLLGANVVSNSYGSGEFSGETAYDFHFNKTGVAFTVSSGDAGYGAEYPAASQYVTAVGGTSLKLNTDGTYQSETAWSGAGSGCSAYESKPTWQFDPDCAKRSVADVSAVADPNTGAAVYDSVRYQGKKGWFKVGGTSLSSPLIAGVYALAGSVPTGVYGNSLPYAAAATYLHDILFGSNGSCSGSYLCTAGVGYDGPTGLGTPNGAGAF
jgi:subtilase family serine protease